MYNILKKEELNASLSNSYNLGRLRKRRTHLEQLKIQNSSFKKKSLIVGSLANYQMNLNDVSILIKTPSPQSIFFLEFWSFSVFIAFIL